MIRIVTDSTADLWQDYVEKRNLVVINMNYRLGENNHGDIALFTHAEDEGEPRFENDCKQQGARHIERNQGNVKHPALRRPFLFCSFLSPLPPRRR